MIELNRNDGELGPRRLEFERSKIIQEMLRIIKPSVRRLTLRKKMPKELSCEVDQHTSIAITRALENWDQNIATFSTHVHWQIRAELQTLQHYAYPERRRLAVPTRIRFLELDRPYAGEEGDSFTMADHLIDDSAEDDVQTGAQRYIALHAFERIFSHSIAKQMQAHSINQKDQVKLAAKRHGMMRNRWMYIRRTLGMETYEQIAQEYGITRERARQIIVGVENELKGMLPRYCKNEERVIPATRRPPEDVHPSWEYLLVDFYMATGEDTRILGKDSPMPTRIEEYDFRPRVLVEEADVGSVAMAPIEDVVEERIEAKPVYVDNVVKMPRPKRSFLQDVAIAATAGALLTSAVAANAQSRAIPPETQMVQTVQTIESPGSTNEARPVRKAVARRQGERVSPVVDITRISVAQPSWGVRIADYQSADGAKGAGNGERKSWQWLRGLRAAYIAPSSASESHGIAFGPLSQAQANGMCHEAKRMAKPCVVVRFGVERQASNVQKSPRA